MMCVHSLMVQITGVALIAGVEEGILPTAEGMRAGLEGSLLKLAPDRRNCGKHRSVPTPGGERESFIVHFSLGY